MTMISNTISTENESNFVTQNEDAKLQKVIKSLIREVRSQRLDYDQLRYIFRCVRQECEIEVPKQEKRLIELPTREEMERFYSVVKKPIHRLIFEFLEGTGLRVSELVSLEVSRIDFQTNRIFVFQGKGNKDRIALLGNRLKAKVQLYLDGKNNRYLFESNRHTRFSSRRIEQLCKGYKERAHVEKDLTPHSFRHMWNTRMAEKGVSEEKRAILAGHSENSDTQKTYTHLSLAGISGEIIPILDDILK